MSTRRFHDDMADTPPFESYEPNPSERQARPPDRAAPRQRSSPAERDSRVSISAHMPRTLAQVMSEANDMVVRGDLTEYVPLPTGLDPLDGMIGGGLRKTELILLGGAQGIGKTIATLQIARNVAMRTGQYAFYLSYEHTETHLMNRLLCLESINPPEIDLKNGIRLKDLYDIIISERAKSTLRGGSGVTGSLQGILRENAKTTMAVARMNRYADRLILVKASPAVTTLRAIREMTARLCDATGGNVTVFIDYLQKVAIHPERASDEAEKVTIIIEGLKDTALALGVPVWAIVAADREGLKSNRLHLFHLRGSSALDYECDIAVIMNNKYHIMSKDHVAFNPYQARQYRDWVVFTVEKNRAGRAMQDMEFQLHAPYFAFDPRGQRVQQQLIDDKIIES
jgi:replicative DNA helicase